MLELSIDAMKKGKVGVTYRGSNEVHYLWSAFDCVVAELPEGDKLFILSGGTWYQIESNFAQRVAIAAENWTRPRDFLPLGTDGEFEKDYNSRASDGNQVHLLDQCFARPAGGRSDIEFCDLLTDGRIVHVKRRTRSSTLSHLFSQGIVSAELFLRDATFRTQICQRLHDLGRDAAIGLIPADRPRSPEWEVVYAIVGVADGASPTSLPFFSQLNFKIAAERLENLGYRVSLRLVPNAPNN